MLSPGGVLARLRRGTKHAENRAATALRMAATSLRCSKTYLGAKFRRLRAGLGAAKAITAMAHMLARFVYRMLRYGEHAENNTLTRDCSTTKRNIETPKFAASRKKRKTSDWLSFSVPLSQHQ
jgi:hypothetical protein